MTISGVGGAHQIGRRGQVEARSQSVSPIWDWKSPATCRRVIRGPAGTPATYVLVDGPVREEEPKLHPGPGQPGAESPYIPQTSDQVDAFSTPGRRPVESTRPTPWLSASRYPASIRASIAEAEKSPALPSSGVSAAVTTL